MWILSGCLTLFFLCDDCWEHLYLARQAAWGQMQTQRYTNGVKMKVSVEEGLFCSVVCTVTERRVLACSSSLIAGFLCCAHNSLSAVIAVSQQCWWPKLPGWSNPFGPRNRLKYTGFLYLYTMKIILWVWLGLLSLQTSFAVNSLQLNWKKKRGSKLYFV